MLHRISVLLVGIGALAGAGAGLAGVLLSRGPDATLTKGTTMEMVLDRPLVSPEESVTLSELRSQQGLSK